EELRRSLIVGLERHEMRFIGQPQLFERYGYLDTVGRWQRIELQAIRMLRGPLARDRKKVERHSICGCQDSIMQDSRRPFGRVVTRRRRKARSGAAPGVNRHQGPISFASTTR